MFQHRWQVFNHSIPHLSYGLIIWQGSEHSSLLTLFPTKFSNAIRVVQEVEEVAKVAKETVHGQPSTSVQKVYHANSKLLKRKKRKPPASGVEILDILAKLVPTLKLFAASARKQVICNLYACLD